MELYYVVSIVERKRAQAFLDLHHLLRLSVVLTNLGHGTATREHLSLYDLEPSEKAVISTVKTRRSIKADLRSRFEDDELIELWEVA